MKILITGNMGYVGSVLARHLRAVMPDAYLIGYDSCFFAHCLTGVSYLPERLFNEQIFGDVRDFPDSLLRNVDAVVQLAAVSNDPMSVRFEQVTSAINYQAAVHIAKKAIEFGVRNVVFASSCSMYGFADATPRKENDPLNPLTAYAKSKADTELSLASLDKGSSVLTSLRFSTACGMSDRLRLDLVLNDFVACALATKEITVLSDGSPWRPLIEVRDMARAIEWAITRDSTPAGQFLAVNVGANNWNYQVRELAEEVARVIPGTKLNVNTEAPPDKRSYKVDFSLYNRIAPNHQPQIDLHQTIVDLKTGLERIGFKDSHFRTSQFMRLKVLEKHMIDGHLNENLFWKNSRLT